VDGGVGGVLAREGVYQGFVVLMGLSGIREDAAGALN
jgi:hypothetical protein